MQTQTKNDRRNPGERFIAWFMWGFIGFVCLCLLSQWLTFSRRDEIFTAYADHVVQLGVKQRTSAQDVRASLLVKADDLSMPIRPEEIYVTGSGPTLKATVRYYADLSVPVINQPVYRVRFNHDLSRQ
jgi:hypothetical protein